MRHLLLQLMTFGLVTAFSLQLHAQQHSSAPFKIDDIAVNGSSLWTVATSDQNGDGIYQYVNGKWIFYPLAQAMTISTTRNNEPIVVTHSGDILVYQGRDWKLIGQRAEIAIGSHRDGNILAYREGRVQFYRNDRWSVQRVGPMVIQDMAQDRAGTLYAINRAGTVYREHGGRWATIQGITGSHIDVGENGNIYVVSDQFEASGNKIFQLKNNQPVPTKYRGRHVVSDAAGKMYVVDGYGRLNLHTGNRVERLTLDKINSIGGSGPFVYGNDVHSVDTLTGETNLFQAISNDDLEGLYTLLSQKSDINKRNKKGETPLIKAVQYGHTEVALSLIDLRADYNLRDLKKLTAMDYALQTTNLPVVESLVRHGAPVNSALITRVLEFNIHPLDRAALVAHVLNGGAVVKANHLEMAAVANDFETYALLADAAIFQKVPLDFNRFLPIAINNNNPDMVFHAVMHGADPNAGLNYGIANNMRDLTILALDRNAFPDPAFELAVRNNDKQLFETLLGKYKASPDVGLEIAVFENHRQFIDRALQARANPNAGTTAAVSTSNVDILKLLLSKGADARRPELIGTAASRGDLPIVLLLLNRGADANDGTLPAVQAGQVQVLDTLLHTADAKRPELIETASVKGDNLIVERLLDKGADANMGILSAVTNGHDSTVELLITNGARTSDPALVNSAASNGDLPITKMLVQAGAIAQNGIFAAVTQNHVDVVAYLIEQGGQVSDASLMLKTVQKSRFNMTKLLISNGGALDAVDNRNNNLLHIAAKNESYPLSELLLKTKKVSIDGVNKDGHTPLMIVVMNGRGDDIHLTRLFVENGADVDARDYDFKPVYKLAKGMKIKKYLKKNGAAKK